MDQENTALTRTSSRRSKLFSRREMLVAGAIAGVAGAVSLSALANGADASEAMGHRDDATTLNKALYYEHQAIWAYSFAAGKLSSTNVGKAVLALALRNQADHKQHRDALVAAVNSLGGNPLTAESSYDVSSYLKKGEGNVDSDVNIAKLALALETDAAIAYATEIAKLKTPALIIAGASIGSTELAHAAAIRATFKALGVNIEIVPSAFINVDNRKAWVLTV